MREATGHGAVGAQVSGGDAVGVSRRCREGAGRKSGRGGRRAGPTGAGRCDVRTPRSGRHGAWTTGTSSARTVGLSAFASVTTPATSDNGSTVNRDAVPIFSELAST